MGAVRDIPRRKSDVDHDAIQRRAGELRLAQFHRSRDSAERDALIQRYLPLARSLAARYRHTSEPFDDLLQVASIGLLKAIERYNPDRGTAFSSFAVPTILGELRRHLRDHTWSIHVPRDLQELGQRLAPATEALSLELGRPPTVTEIAARLGTTEEQVMDAREAVAAHSPASLDEPVKGDDSTATLADLLGSDDRAIERADDALLLDHYLTRLPARSREVLRLRFQEDLKQREIGAILGVSQMHVSRLIRQSLEQLQTIAADEARSPSHS
jgi:RNA polymerase sigma-B factor